MHELRRHSVTKALQGDLAKNETPMQDYFHQFIANVIKTSTQLNQAHLHESSKGRQTKPT